MSQVAQFPTVTGVNYLHWVELCIRRFTFSQFDGRNAQAPDIRLVVIPTLFNDLWGHPVRGSNKRVLLGGQGSRKLARYTKIREFYVTPCRKQDVGGY